MKESNQSFWVEQEAENSNLNSQNNSASTPPNSTSGNSAGHQTKLDKKRQEKLKQEQEGSPNEKREVVMHGAELKCQYAQAPGKLVVTSNEINLQDQLWATEGDGNNMINLQFKGTCSHPTFAGQTPPPCLSVIKLTPWQNLGTSYVQEQKVLVKESYCVCTPVPNVATPKPIPVVESIANKEDENKIGKIKDGWWSLDREGNKKIKRAISGMVVYFHIETESANSEIIHLKLFDDDNNEPEESNGSDQDLDDSFSLVDLNTGAKLSEFYTVENEKVVLPISIISNQEFLRSDIDEKIEFYFRCSLNGENIELPKNREDYLVVGTLVIDRYKMPGLNSDGTDISDDMTYGFGIPISRPIYNDLASYKSEYIEKGFNTDLHADYANKLDYHKPIYSKAEIYSVKTNSGYESGKDLQNFHEGVSPLTGNLRDNDYLFWNFRNTAGLYFAHGELQGNLDRMIDFFQSNSGGVYEDDVLTKNIINHEETIKYCSNIENYISKEIIQKLTELNNVDDPEPYFENQSKEYSNSKGKRIDNGKGKFTRPAYSYDNGLWEASKGLTIALNDIWSTEVILSELKIIGNNYTAKYQVTLWDHFGLDLPDMKKKFNELPSIKEAFACWFVLQHLRGFKPFITKITFLKEISGTL